MKHGKKQDSVTLLQKNNKHNQGIKLHLVAKIKTTKTSKELL